MFRNEARTNYAFNLIVRKHTPALYRLIRRMVIDAYDTDDVLQNVFIKAWKGLPNFREDAALGTWLFRIASNESITFINKKRRFLFIPFQSQETYLNEKLEADPAVDYEAGEKKFKQAILSLPDKQRLVFNMKFYEDMTYEQIAEITGTSVGALKASYHIASKKIETLLQPD
jgi:RNA polymerase sigma factor (sigma-70 family)